MTSELVDRNIQIKLDTCRHQKNETIRRVNTASSYRQDVQCGHRASARADTCFEVEIVHMPPLELVDVLAVAADVARVDEDAVAEDAGVVLDL